MDNFVWLCQEICCTFKRRPTDVMWFCPVLPQMVSAGSGHWAVEGRSSRSLYGQQNFHHRRDCKWKQRFCVNCCKESTEEYFQHKITTRFHLCDNSASTNQLTAADGEQTNGEYGIRVVRIPVLGETANQRNVQDDVGCEQVPHVPEFTKVSAMHWDQRSKWPHSEVGKRTAGIDIPLQESVVQKHEDDDLTREYRQTNRWPNVLV